MDDAMGNPCDFACDQCSLEYSGYNYSKNRCESIVQWFVDKYLPRHKLEIVVHHRGLVREGVYGWCTVLDCDWRPRAFEIELHNQMSIDDYTSTSYTNSGTFINTSRVI